MLLNMFQDVSAAPVAKDDSFTLVQEGLAHFLKNKYYHHGIRGEKFREKFIDVVSNIRTQRGSRHGSRRGVASR